MTEERKKDGLALDASILENTSLASLDRVSIGQHVQRDKQRKMVLDKATELDVRPLKLDQLLRHMSGGNQQKVVLAKWLLLSGLKVLILDEPNARRRYRNQGPDLPTDRKSGRSRGRDPLDQLRNARTSWFVAPALRPAQWEIVAELDPDKTNEHEIFVAAAGVGLQSKTPTKTKTPRDDKRDSIAAFGAPVAGTA